MTNQISEDAPRFAMNVQPEFRFRDEISIRVGICNEPMFHYLGICVSTDIGSGDHLAFCLVGLTSCLGFGRSWVRVPLPATSVITVCNEPMFHYLGICVSTDIGSGDHLAFCLVGLTSCLGFGRSWVRVPLPATSVITVVSTDRPFDRARFR